MARVDSLTDVAWTRVRCERGEVHAARPNGALLCDKTRHMKAVEAHPLTCCLCAVLWRNIHPPVRYQSAPQ